MQIRRKVVVKIKGKEKEFDTIFDSGSSITIMSTEIKKEFFGGIEERKLSKIREIVLPNGERMSVDSYIDAEIKIDDYMIEERIYLSKEFKKVVVVKGREVKLPDLIIGAPTMETWGIELDLKTGKIRSCREGFLLI
ncbi:MAG: pepsin/retropepsin-like aspartic protease family protein [Candidatus Methanospirareceae archaeon]